MKGSDGSTPRDGRGAHSRREDLGQRPRPAPHVERRPLRDAGKGHEPRREQACIAANQQVIRGPRDIERHAAMIESERASVKATTLPPRGAKKAPWSGISPTVLSANLGIVMSCSATALRGGPSRAGETSALALQDPPGLFRQHPQKLTSPPPPAALAPANPRDPGEAPPPLPQSPRAPSPLGRARGVREQKRGAPTGRATRAHRPQIARCARSGGGRTRRNVRFAGAVVATEVDSPHRSEPIDGSGGPLLYSTLERSRSLGAGGSEWHRR